MCYPQEKGREKSAEIFLSLEFANSVMLKHFVESCDFDKVPAEPTHVLNSTSALFPGRPKGVMHPATQIAIFSTVPRFPGSETCCFPQNQGCGPFHRKSNILEFCG